MARRVEDAAPSGVHAAKKLAALGRRFDAAGWKPASQGLREVRAVPTIFPIVDSVLGVGGWPTDRFGLVHGESNEGKTAFALGLILSFLLRGHCAALVDAERSTPASWVRRLFPTAMVESPLFRHLFPTTYEATVDAVRRWAEAIGDAREHGEIDADTTGILVLDSLRKLVPKRLLDKLLKEGSEEQEPDKPGRFGKKRGGGVDGMGGRAAQYKAALNAAWMDELTVLLAQTGTAMVAIGREYKNAEGGGSLSFGDDWTLGGGQAIYFESSVVVRVGSENMLYEGVDKERVLVGERHSVQVRKTKVGGKEQRYPLAHFHTSNGAALPFGFDRARDLLEVGVDCGVVELKGAWYSFGGERLGQGGLPAARRLTDDLALEHRVEEAVRATFPEVSSALPTRPAPVRKGVKLTKKGRGKR